MNKMSLKLLKKLGFYGLLIIILFFSLAPFYWQIVSSISLDRDLLQRPPQWVPKEPVFYRYGALLGVQEGVTGTRLDISLASAARNFRYSAANSLIVAIITTVLSLTLGTLAAYAITRLRFRGRQFIFLLIIGTKMIPPISIVIPLYMAIRALQLMDTKMALILTYTSFMLPLVIWIMAAFFRTVPWDIEEAALIDGCSPLSALFRVILPLSTPGIVAATIVAFLFAWNEFFFSLIFTNTLASKTITKTISEFSSAMGAGLDYGLVSTGGILSSLPPIAIALFFQRFLVQGLTGGAVKQ